MLQLDVVAFFFEKDLLNFLKKPDYLNRSNIFGKTYSLFFESA